MPDGRPKAIGATTGHRTKAEMELRQAAEEQMNSGKTITPGPVLLEDAAAAAYYDRVIQLLDEVDLNEAFYENVITIAFYCRRRTGSPGRGCAPGRTWSGCGQKEGPCP